MKHTTVDDNYFLEYGLENDPFPLGSVDSIFYNTPELNHRLELVRHLLEFSQQIILICSPTGAGKSSFARHLVSIPDENWSLTQILAENGIDNATLVREIVSKSQPDYVEEEGEGVESIAKYNESCYRAQLLPVIVIDNAHELPIETLEFIVQISKQKHQSTQLRIVLLGNENINAKLDDPRIKVISSGVIHTINLPAFSQEQVKEYLHYRISASGDIDKKIFSNKDINHIYKASGGVPAKIDLLARQVLQDPALMGGKDLNKGSNVRQYFWSILRYTIGIFLLVVIFWAVYKFMFVDKSPRQVDEIAVSLPPSQPLHGQSGIQNPASQHQGANLVIKPTVQPQDSTPEVRVENQDVLDKNLTPDVVEEVDIVLDTGTILSKTPVVLPVSEAVEIKNEQVLIEKTREKDKAMIEGIKGSDWLLQQAPEQYTLQLMGARELKTIEVFIQGLTGYFDQMALFTTENNSMPWHVIVYGSYADRDTASQYIVDLPVKIRNQKPWPRPFASIQLDIEKLAD